MRPLISGYQSFISIKTYERIEGEKVWDGILECTEGQALVLSHPTLVIADRSSHCADKACS